MPAYDISPHLKERLRDQYSISKTSLLAVFCHNVNRAMHKRKQAILRRESPILFSSAEALVAPEPGLSFVSLERIQRRRFRERSLSPFFSHDTFVHAKHRCPESTDGAAQKQNGPADEGQAPAEIVHLADAPDKGADEEDEGRQGPPVPKTVHHLADEETASKRDSRIEKEEFQESIEVHDSRSQQEDQWDGMSFSQEKQYHVKYKKSIAGLFPRFLASMRINIGVITGEEDLRDAIALPFPLDNLGARIHIS